MDGVGLGGFKMQSNQKNIPTYHGTLRSHSINLPDSIYRCSGMVIFGRRIKSLVFSTDVAIIKNINADAVIAVYPFTPQPVISQAIISVSDAPVFVGVGGGLTGGERVIRLAQAAENYGAFGVVVNAPIKPDLIAEIKKKVEIPVVATIVSENQDIRARLDAGADILNVAASVRTPELVRRIRESFPDAAIIATGGPNEDTIAKTIEAGANCITYTPPSNGEIFAESMAKYRERFQNEKE